MVPEPDTEAVLKAYALGLFTAALALALVATIWIGTQPRQEPGLVWGGAVYTSKEEFNVYLKSKGLSYKTWVARNPDAAPWEADTISIGAITVRVSARGDSVMRLFLVAIGLLLAIGTALLLLGRQNPVLVRFAGGSVVFFSVFSAVVLLAIWFGGQPKVEPGLLWGGSIYTTKQEFNVYLKSKGLSYETWVARNPGAAPWEPPAVQSSTKAPEPTQARAVAKAPATTDTSSDWVGRPLLAVIALMLAAVSGLLLLRSRRPVLARYAAAPSASGTVSIGGGSAGSPRTAASIERVGGVASAAAESLKGSARSTGARLFAAALSFARMVIDGAKAVIAGAREVRSGLAHVMRERHVSGGDVAYGVIAIMSPVVFALIVVFVLSA